MVFNSKLQKTRTLELVNTNYIIYVYQITKLKTKTDFTDIYKAKIGYSFPTGSSQNP